MSEARPTAAGLRDLVGDRRQLASVRRIELDEGGERGVRALAFSTGGGLDFWVLADRAMDIGPLWCDGRPVAWQSAAGFRHPSLVDAEGDGGFGFGRGFSGFLMTCGLDHTRWPLDGRPQHGRLPFLPARVTACGEDWSAATPYLFCEGEVTQFRHGGESLVLIRRIETPIGQRTLTIRDRVENRSIAAQRHALLYHCNIGYPALRPGAEVLLAGARVTGPIGAPDATARPLSFSRPVGESDAVCTLTDGRDRVVECRFSGATLPHLQVWHDPRPRSYVLALEPCTSARPADAGVAAEEPKLQPDEARCYALDFHFFGAGAV